MGSTELIHQAAANPVVHDLRRPIRIASKFGAGQVSSERDIIFHAIGAHGLDAVGNA